MLRPIPPVVLAYGLAGLIPFLLAPLVSIAFANYADAAAAIQMMYAVMILSFLGGARWGQAVQQPTPDTLTVSLAMVPTLFGLGIVVANLWLGFRGQLVLLAAALLLHWLWDTRSSGLPPWYPRLRAILTAGAVTGLLAQALLIG